MFRKEVMSHTKAHIHLYPPTSRLHEMLQRNMLVYVRGSPALLSITAAFLVNKVARAEHCENPGFSGLSVLCIVL